MKAGIAIDHMPARTVADHGKHRMAQEPMPVTLRCRGTTCEQTLHEGFIEKFGDRF